jgi:hypothetical protein
MRKETISAATCWVLIVALCGSLISPAFGQEKVFEGKTIRIIVGFAAGGGFDIYSRAIARHVGRHIPGNPSVIIRRKSHRQSVPFRAWFGRQDENDSARRLSVAG